MATKLCKKYMNSWLEVLRCFRYWPGRTQEMNPSASTSWGKEPVKVIPSCTICLIQPWHAKWKTHSKNKTKRSSKMGVHDAYLNQSLSIIIYCLLQLLSITYYLLPIIYYLLSITYYLSLSITLHCFSKWTGTSFIHLVNWSLGTICNLPWAPTGKRSV